MTFAGNDKNGNAGSTDIVVPLEKIIEGMQMQPLTGSSYLNKVTGDVVIVSEEAIIALDHGEDTEPVSGEPLDLAKDALNSPDYIKLPDHFEIDEYNMMVRFAESHDDSTASNKLFGVLHGNSAFRRFKDVIRKLELSEQWYEFRDREYEQAAIDWCLDNDIRYAK